MAQIFSIAIIVLFWLLSFLEPSGWALAIKLPEKVDIVIAVITAIIIIFSPNKRPRISRILIIWTLISFIIIPLLQADSWEGATYLVSFLVIYLVSLCKITPKVIKYSAIIIAVLGIAVLRIYINGSILSGWNDNAIAMVGLFSFSYFSIFLILKTNNKQFWLWNIVTVIYLEMLFETDCRSGMLFSIIAVIGIIFSKQIRKYFSGDKSRFIILNAPLIIALVVIAVAGTPLFESLNNWSIASNDKEIFDGRDILWQEALDYLSLSNYLGSGKFEINYHNCGVAALSVFGVLGYICWIKLLNANLKELKYYLSDKIVLGSFWAFIVIFLQQSLDLGLISPTPNLLPYTILGVGLGRVRQLKGRQLYYSSFASFTIVR